MILSRWTAALGGLLVVALAGSAQAQSYESLGEGLKVGHFVLHPSLAYEYTYDNNILFMSTDLPGSDPIASGAIVLRARLLADLPIRHSRIRLVYAPFTRGYTSDRFEPEDRLNHVFDMEGLFQTGRAITLAFRDHYVNGTVSLQEQVDERNGLPFGLGHYAIHNPQVEIGVTLGVRHGFSLLPSYSRSSFTGFVSNFVTGLGPPASGQIVDYGYTTRTIEGRYSYKLSEPTSLYGYSAFEGTTQTLTGTRDVTIQSRSIGLGLTRTVNEGLVTQVSAGYQGLDFDGGRGRNFSGPVAEASVVWQVAEVTRLDFGLLRKPYASIYADSNYYIATEGRARWTRQLGRSSYMDAGALLQENQYVPMQGVGRRERLIRLDVGTGHQFVKNLRGYVGIQLEERESNVLQMSGGVGADPFHYQLHRILFRLEAGWL
ncbi:MAG TPA: outer membrane beta-barrel protein [Candidatus Polarisedimenticolia bacterium]|nr:outer membrane beta-barrel protein [Candidatus Polarisedimenticolia bacterium]